MQALDMPSVRELEDLIIDAIYLDILKGKLDQKHGQLEVEYTIGRDLEPGKIESVLETLKDWCVCSSILGDLIDLFSDRAANTAAVLNSLDQQLVAVASQAAAEKAYQEEHEKVFAATVRDVLDRHRDKGGIHSFRRGVYSLGPDSMDVDDPVENVKAKSRKCVVVFPLALGAPHAIIFLQTTRDEFEAAEKEESTLIICVNGFYSFIFLAPVFPPH